MPSSDPTANDRDSRRESACAVGGSDLRTDVHLKREIFMRTHVDVVIVGGGQVGLSVSYYLTRQGRNHLVLEQSDKPAEAWRNHRWDSFTLVTFLYPTRLASEARWRAGVRLTLDPLGPLLILPPRPPFHRTRTVAGAAPRARLDKDWSPWRRSPLVSMYRRTASMLPCVQVVKILPCRALVPGSTTSWRVSRF